MTTWAPPQLLDHPTTAVISHRQAQVLDGYCEGLLDKDIARRHGINLETVRTHGQLLRRALGAADRTHAVALACTGAVRVDVQRRPGAHR